MSNVNHTCDPSKSGDSLVLSCGWKVPSDPKRGHSPPPGDPRTSRQRKKRLVQVPMVKNIQTTLWFDASNPNNVVLENDPFNGTPRVKEVLGHSSDSPNASLTQSNFGNRPLYGSQILQGLNAINIGVNESLKVLEGLNFSLTGTKLTVLVVGKYLGTTEFGAFWALTKDAEPQPSIALTPGVSTFDSKVKYSNVRDGEDVYQNFSPVNPNNSPGAKIHAVTLFPDGKFEINTNGKMMESTNNPSDPFPRSFEAAPLNTFYLGVDGSLDGASMLSHIGEVIVLPSDNKMERQAMEGYLAWKWGLVGDLPPSHPYKTTKVVYDRRNLDLEGPGETN